MTPTVHAGSILIDDQRLMAQVLGLESEPYVGGWSVVNSPDSFALDRKIHATGWNFFFMADEVKVMSFGVSGAQRIHNALIRILAKVRHQHYNCLEVSGIVAKRFLGVPYAVVSAHSRHIQKSCELDSAEGRRVSYNDTEWARG